MPARPLLGAILGKQPIIGLLFFGRNAPNLCRSVRLSLLKKMSLEDE